LLCLQKNLEVSANKTLIGEFLEDNAEAHSRWKQMLEYKVTTDHINYISDRNTKKSVWGAVDSDLDIGIESHEHLLPYLHVCSLPASPSTEI
jgi:hypothetical protein